MKVRVCDKVVDTKTKKEKITNIRVVSCSALTSGVPESLIGWEMQFVLLYIDPETRKATVDEMWLKDMVEQ